ncbi:Hsp20/alpha crystallin family protein [Candidatus Dependentiae bacterium]|nr:Hsp20/alpha crystallin family protein [Candidatus Dependentiae bacterium]
MKVTYKSFALLLAFPIHFSIWAQSSDILNNTTAARPSTLKTLTDIQKDVVKELDTLFDDKKPVEDLTPDLRDNLEQLHETASEIKRQTGKLLKSRKNRTASVWDSMFNDMERSQKAFGNFFSNLRKDFGTRAAAASYKINEFESDDGQSYGISISMPGFNEEQVRVSIEENEKDRYKTNRLKIVAHTDVPQKTRSESNGKTVIKHSSQQVASSTYVHGRQQSISYKDGKLNAVIDLPRTIKPDKYTMTFENNVLKIEFEKDNQAEAKTKKLEFTSK